MLVSSKRRKRRGSVLTEYGLLIGGVVLASVVGVALLGRKISDVISVTAATLPGAQPEDNLPISAGNTIPLDSSDGTVKLAGDQLVSQSGLDRFQDVFGPGAAALLVAD